MSAGWTMEQVRGRIAKLLRLTEANGASPAEAATAFAMAQRLMLEHDIVSAEADTSAAGPDDSDVFGWWEEHRVGGSWKGAVPPWVRSLAWRIADNLGCAYTRFEGATEHAPGTGDDSRVHFFGRRQDAEACAYLLRLAIAEVERLARAWGRAHPGRGRELRAFRSGCADGIQSALRDEKMRAKTRYASDSRALAILDRAKVARAESGVRYGGTLSYAGRGSDAYGSGYRAGQGVNLSGSRGSIGSGALRLGPGGK